MMEKIRRCRLGFRCWKLVVENNVQKRAMDLQPAVVMNETQLPESVHEEADRPGRAHHLREGLLTDLGKYSLGYAFLAEVSQQQQNPS